MATEVQRESRDESMNNSAQDAPTQEGSPGSSDIPMLEWIVGGLGFLLIAGVIAFTLYHAAIGTDSAPDVNVSVISIQQNRSGYLVKVRARNHGGSTAEGVVIEGHLKDGAQVVERSHTTLDYAPPGSEKQAGLFFTRDPRQFELQLRALGYEEP